MKISKCWNNEVNEILKFCMPGVNAIHFDLLQRVKKAKWIKAVRSEDTWPVQMWVFDCVSQVMEKKQYQILESGFFFFCKIPLSHFASDLVAEEQLTLKEKNNRGLVISYKHHQCKSQGGCGSKTEISCKTSIPPSSSSRKENGQNLRNYCDALHRP